MSAPRLPVIGEFVRGVGRLVEIETIPPPPQPPPEVDYIFEVISARGELRRAGRVLKVLSAITITSDSESSVRECVETMAAYCAAEAITPESEVEVVVVRVAEYSRQGVDDRREANFYDKTFLAFDWRRPDRRRPAPRESVETVVWSSRGKPGEEGFAEANRLARAEDSGIPE